MNMSLQTANSVAGSRAGSEKRSKMPNIKKFAKKQAKKAGKVVKTGTSPITYIPKTAAKGYKRATAELRKRSIARKK